MSNTHKKRIAIIGLRGSEQEDDVKVKKKRHTKEGELESVNNRGQTSLFVAVSNADVVDIEYLLKQGSNVNHADNEGKTPLMFAIKHETANIVQMLLANGADVNAADNVGEHVIHYAALSTPEILRLVLIYSPNLNAVDKDANTPLILAVHENKNDIAEKLISNEETNVNSENATGNTPLILATERNNAFIVRELLKKPGIDVDHSNLLGWTALGLAAKDGYDEIVKMLLDAGADINLKNDGASPLFMASRLEDLKTFKLIAERGAKEFRRVMYDLVTKGNKEGIDILLNAKIANIDNVIDTDGSSALLLSIKNKDYDLASFLLEKGANGTLKNNFDENAADLLVKIAGFNKTPKTLLEKLQRQELNIIQEYVRLLENIFGRGKYEQTHDLQSLENIDLSAAREDRLAEELEQLHAFTSRYLKKNSASLVESKYRLGRNTFYCSNSVENIPNNRFIRLGSFCWNIEDLLEYIKQRAEQNGEINVNLRDKHYLNELKTNPRAIPPRLWHSDNEKMSIIDHPSGIGRELDSVLQKYSNPTPEPSLPEKIENESISHDVVDILNRKQVKSTSISGRELEGVAALLFFLQKNKNVCVPFLGSYFNEKSAEKEILFGRTLIWQETTQKRNEEPCNGKLFIPSWFVQSLQSCIRQKNVRFIIGLITLSDIQGNHTNAYLIDLHDTNSSTKKDEISVEIFEPNGNVSEDFFCNEQYISALKTFFLSIPDGPTVFYDSRDFCPVDSFQRLQARENEHLLTEIGGFCQAWSIWWINFRLENTLFNGTRKELAEAAMKQLQAQKENGISLTQFIRNYAEFIVQERNKIIENAFENVYVGQFFAEAVKRFSKLNAQEWFIVEKLSAALKYVRNSPKYEGTEEARDFIQEARKEISKIQLEKQKYFSLTERMSVLITKEIGKQLQDVHDNYEEVLRRKYLASLIE